MDFTSTLTAEEIEEAIMDYVQKNTGQRPHYLEMQHNGEKHKKDTFSAIVTVRIASKDKSIH